MTLFSELYGAYYNAVAKIIAEAINSPVTVKKLRAIIENEAFSESASVILSAFDEQRWQILNPDGSTAIKRIPTMPMTELEKRWLKAISLDPRLALFGEVFPELDGVAPLFTPDDYRIFDQYADGDNYQSADYIENFRTALAALRSGDPLFVRYLSARGERMTTVLTPINIEYSEKDDKFRLVGHSRSRTLTLNMNRVLSCQIYDGEASGYREPEKPPQHCIVLEILNERNALERVLLHFAHFKKQAERIDEKRYKLTLWYDRGDDTEIVIRVLSFGARLKVLSPDSFAELIRERLRKQLSYGLISETNSHHN
ncbi:MAG: WYL domain-containing protein [Clostridia bacterium]|nr:WYL domain-containing protein [Clostridia bacterium]